MSTTAPDNLPPPGPEQSLGRDEYCRNCGYNLRGLVPDLCPECGEDVRWVMEKRPQIPWLFRRERGLMRSYWGTVLLFISGDAAIGGELERHAYYADAQRFRLVTILHVLVPLAAATLGLHAMDWPWPIAFSVPTAFQRSWPLVPGFLGCSTLCLLAVTGVPSYFFHPRTLSVRSQNAAIALSYFTSAPLALTVVPLLVLWLAMLAGSGSVAGHFLYSIAWATAALLLLAWWWLVVRLAWRVLPRRVLRATFVLVAVPIGWAVAAALCCLGPFYVYFYVRLVLASLHSASN